MTYYQTQAVTSANDRQLSEKYRRLTEENNSLEVRIQTLHALAPEIIQRKEEYGVLLEKFEHLANQSNSFPSKQTPGLRDVGGSGAVRNGAPGFQSSLSWDCEALALKERKSGEPGNEAEVLEKIIARFENELTTNKIELELIQKQMQGQSENEKISKKEEPMQEGETVNRMSYVTTSGQDISSTSTDKIQELENLVNLLNRRIEELLEKDQEMENRVNILNKQKEELLHVNHQWDEQYRLLKDDKDRTISEMKKRTNTQLVSEAELQGQDDEVSQQRNKQVVELTQKNKALSEEVARLLEKQQKTDQLWVSAKKMITEEREARTAACQQKQLMQERYKELENQLQVEKQTQGYLKQETERLVSGSDQSSSGSPVGNLPLPSNVTEQFEMLKQQMCVYADDFANERSDRERIQAEREVQKENLKAYENDIYLLKEQVRIYQDNFDKERREKEKVQRQLRDRRQASDESSWYEVPPNDYMAMGVANPVQRRQYDKGGKAFSVILFAKARLLCDKPKDSTHSSTVHYDILEQTSFVKTKNGSVFIYGVFQSDEAREESTVLKEKSVRKENLVQRVHRVLKDVRFTDISTPRDLAPPHASSSSSGNSSTSEVTRTEKYYTQEETDKLAQKAVDRFQFEITILQLSTLLKQADSSRRKLTLTRLATTQVPFTILSLTGNSCNEDCLAVCGLKDCHVLTLSGSGSVVNHLALHPQLETGNFIIKAVWLPGSQTEIAIVTADSVKT